VWRGGGLGRLRAGCLLSASNDYNDKLGDLRDECNDLDNYSIGFVFIRTARWTAGRRARSNGQLGRGDLRRR